MYPCPIKSKSISIRVPRGRDDHVVISFPLNILEFQSASLVGGTTEKDDFSSYWEKDFNPRPSWEGRRCSPESCRNRSQFQSASLVGGTTNCLRLDGRFFRFQSASLVGGTTLMKSGVDVYMTISIRVPRGRDDPQHDRHYKNLTVISIRVPRGRDDSAQARERKESHIFQSASLVGGTTSSDRDLGNCKNISIRVPRGRDDTILEF